MQIFSQGTHLYMSLFLSACPSVCPYICCAPYLRNCTSCDHNSWYTWVRWWYLQVFFFIYLKFWFFRLLEVGGGGGVKGQKIAQNEIYKLHISHIISQEYDQDFWYTFVKQWYLQAFCQNVDFLGHRVKWQKIVQSDQNFCLLCSVFKEPCIMWLSSMLCITSR